MMRIAASLALLGLIACGSEEPNPGADAGMTPLVDAGVTLDTAPARRTTLTDTGTTPAHRQRPPTPGQPPATSARPRCGRRGHQP